MAVDVCAPITGTIWKVLVQQGESVEAGQTVVIMESMKMEVPVDAPEAGLVTRLSVSEGQVVEDGDLVLVLDPAGPQGSVPGPLSTGP